MIRILIGKYLQGLRYAKTIQMLCWISLHSLDNTSVPDRSSNQLTIFTGLPDSPERTTAMHSWGCTLNLRQNMSYIVPIP